MIGILISHEDDYQAAFEKFGKEGTYIFHSKYVDQKIYNGSLLDFYQDHFYPSDSILQKIANNWYRDENHKDMTLVSDISIGMSMHHKVSVDTVSIAREYFSLKYWQDKLDFLYISDKETELFKFVANQFGFIKYFSFGKDIDCSYKFCSTYSVDYSNILSSACVRSTIARSIQNLFVNNIYNKKIFLSDWTYKALVKKNRWFLQNDPNIKYGFYLTKLIKKKYKEQSNRTFPYNIDFLFSKDLPLFLKTITLKEIDSDFLSLLWRYIKNIYLMDLDNYRKIYYTFLEAYKHYKPKVIVFPGENHPIYLIAIQLASSLGIQTRVMYDGNMVYPIKAVLKSENLNPIVTKYYPFGEAGKYLMQIGGIETSHQTKVITPPMFQNIRSCKKPGSKIIIMTYVADDVFLNGRRDFRFSIVIDITKMLLNMGFKSIAFKMKPGLGGTEEHKILVDILEKQNLSKYVDFYFGNFLDVICNARMIIGYLGSSIVEATYMNIPYYIYEPKENGHKSNRYLFKDIAYNIEELENNINKEKSSNKIAREYFL